jgi:hypothetical protein
MSDWATRYHGESEADRAQEARDGGAAIRRVYYSTRRAVAYGLDGLYGHPKQEQRRVELEAGAARFTPGLPVYVPRSVAPPSESELRAMGGDR